MNAAERDPVVDGLDRLAGLADDDLVGNRMPDIRRRVRVARQRRMATVGVAAVATLAVGAGVWKVLPSGDEKPQPAPMPPPGIEQTIYPHATSVADGVLDIGFTIAGRSSAYTDAAGSPVPAAPSAIRLSVDGAEVPGMPAPKDLSCEPGGEVSEYGEMLPGEPVGWVFAVPVEGVGEHRVEVRASYCADGELLESVATVLATTESSTDVAGETRADLDGDGDDETIQLLVPADGGDSQKLRVTRADGLAQNEELPNTMTRTLEAPADFNGDGRPEIVVAGGGGEYAEYAVFHLTETGSLVSVVQVVDSRGKQVTLSSGSLEGQPLDEAWQLVYQPGRFLSWRAREPFPTRPATVDVRLWNVGPSVFMFEEKKLRTGCWNADLSLTLGPC